MDVGGLIMVKNEAATNKDFLKKQELLGREVWKTCRNELHSYFPYLDGAFSGITYEVSKQTGTFGTNGNVFCYSPVYIFQQYMDSPVKVKRAYLHMMFHCLYLHIFCEKELNKPCWNLACDIAVEWMVDRFDIQGIQQPLSKIRKRCYEFFAGRPISAEKIYSMMMEKRLPWSAEQLEGEFIRDDHGFWGQTLGLEELARIRRKWEVITAYTSKNVSDNKRKAGSQKGEGDEETAVRKRGRYDYRKFLKKFALPREEVELDTESFDYIFYHYGIEHYKNMPLIEPLEYKEVNKLEELVIAIDTSGSCSRETVQRFLEETYTILSEKENFFKKMNVYLLQCDCYIQDVVKLTCEEDWKSYRENIRIQGRGGTDFRPVFAYVEDLKQKKEIRSLKALIYFTDGDGIYPRKKPEYETAFVFLNDTIKQETVPMWAIKLTLDGGSNEH